MTTSKTTRKTTRKTAPKAPRKKAAAKATADTPPAPRKTARGRKAVDPGKTLTGSFLPSGGALVVVESPTKAKTIGRILGAGYTVLSSQGHVVDLPRKELGVDPENGFAANWQPIPEKKKILDQIVKAAKGSARVFLATDPDREGEAIAHFIAQRLPTPPEEVFRILFHEITREGIAGALGRPGKVNTRLVEAQQARRAIDRLAGYKLSRLLWDKVWRSLSGGRVQSVALRLVVDREREIWAHRPEDYWVITAALAAGEPPVFHARLATRDGEKLRITNQAEADRTAAELRSLPFTASEVRVRPGKRSPAPPFITSTLQQEASRKLGYTAKRTMALAQQLYEGIPMGELGTTGLITYMRTDSVRVAEEAVEKARGEIRARFGERHLPPQMRTYKNRKGAQDAHEAIRPSRPDLTPERVAPFLDRDQLRLYELVYRRFLASQMADAELSRTRVKVTAGPYGLNASGDRLLFPGFLSLYQEGKDEGSRPPPNAENGEAEEEDGTEDLPPLESGQSLTLRELASDKKTTQPPPRYNDASLVRELEEKGIGRPSTYATILDTIVKRGYVEKKERRYHPSELGLAVSDLLVQGFPDNVMDTGFTARMEDELDGVEEGTQSYERTLEDFYAPFSRALTRADKELAVVKAGLPTGMDCPTCGKELLIRFSFRAGSFAGAFLGCSAYPECKFTSNFARDEQGRLRITERPPQELREERCPTCEARMVAAEGRYGRYLRCSTVDCKGVRAYPTGVPCPECGGNLVEKRSRFGYWYPCDGYPDCRFSVRNFPLARPCPECGYPLVTRREGKRGASLTCPSCKHRAMEEDRNSGGEAGGEPAEGKPPGEDTEA